MPCTDVGCNHHRSPIAPVGSDCQRYIAVGTNLPRNCWITIRRPSKRWCAARHFLTRWGLDHKLGADTPIPQIPRGRALARLNVLTAQRLAAQGNSQEATLHLLAGIRFAQDLSQDMSLIGALTGKLALVSDLNAAVTLAQSNKLSKSDRENLHKRFERYRRMF